MTPSQGDMAFVLESVPGVAGVYAVESRWGADEIELFVQVVEDWRCVAAAHYALLRLLRHEDCQRLAIMTTMPPLLAGRVTEIVLSPAERFAAMGRVSTRAAALAEERRVEEQRRLAEERERESRAQSERPRQWPWSVLVFESDETVVRAAHEAFKDADIQQEVTFKKAIRAVRAGGFNLVLCQARSAFGLWGFIACVKEARPTLASRVIIVADERERDVVAASTSQWKLPNRCVVKPVTAESLRLVSTAPLGHEVFNVPTAPPASPPPTPAEPDAFEPRPAPRASRAPRPDGRTPIVLLVDDEPDTEDLASALAPFVHLIRASDEWTALDKVALGELDLLVCSASMKVAGDKPLYRMLWNARPELKARSALLMSPHRVPASARGGSTRGVLTRPLSADAIRALLAAHA